MSKMIKKWKSFEEQLDMLEYRGLIITDRDKALKYLERIGYYRLSGYWYPFRKKSTWSDKKSDEFLELTTFEQVINLYIFDKKLRLLVIDAIERIEMAIRVDVAYILGMNNGLAYLETKELHGKFSKQVINKGINRGKTQQQVWVEKFNVAIKRNHKTDFVKHHIEQYDGNLPIWVAIELLDFGMISTLYSGLKNKDKDKIALKYNVENGEIFAQWLRSLNHLRNIAAHHSRLWNSNIVDRSDAKTILPNAQLNNAKPFMYFCIMKQLLNVICPHSKWGERVKELYLNFPIQNSNYVDVQQTGSKKDWQLWALWA